jgi:hypothetical protein
LRRRGGGPAAGFCIRHVVCPFLRATSTHDDSSLWFGGKQEKRERLASEWVPRRIRGDPGRPAPGGMVGVMRKPDRSDNQPASLPKNRVVPIDQANPPNPEKPSFVVSDPVSIFAIGGRRIALDFAARISELAPTTGDAPAPVLPWSKGDRRADRNDPGASVEGSARRGLVRSD